MYNSLDIMTADYTAEVLSLPGSVSLPQKEKRMQIVNTFDDGGTSISSVSENIYFKTQLQWGYLEPEGHEIIMNLWHDSSKANGFKRTFYWLHPIDGKTYVARFTTPITTKYNGIGQISINSVSLRIEGYDI